MQDEACKKSKEIPMNQKKSSSRTRRRKHRSWAALEVCWLIANSEYFVIADYYFIEV